MNTASSSEDSDPLREARAYNQSIYIMVAMPYLLLGMVGLLIYRGVRAAQKPLDEPRREERSFS